MLMNDESHVQFRKSASALGPKLPLRRKEYAVVMFIVCL